MKKQNVILFYALGIYVVLQFIWWGYHLIELTQEVGTANKEVSGRILMILSEGSVFLLILILGLWKIRSSIKKEIKLTRQQNNFILSVTHELKTPLAATQLYLQTIIKRDLDEQKRKDILLKAINENKRLELLIENMLNAASLEGNSFKPVKSTKNLSEFLFQLIEETNKRLGISLVDSNIEPNVLFDFDDLMIQTILNNLLDNALKYAGKASKITVVLKKTEQELILQVKDYGPGIPIENSNDIFQKFNRLGNEETRSQKGSGLGLFICSEFSKLHKGKITYIPNQPKGSIFQINFHL